jgi:hypothetical protein
MLAQVCHEANQSSVTTLPRVEYNSKVSQSIDTVSFLFFETGKKAFALYLYRRSKQGYGKSHKTKRKKRG